LALQSELLQDSGLTLRPLAAGTPGRRIGLVWRRTSGRGAHYRELANTLRGLLGGGDAATPRPRPSPIPGNPESL